MARTLVVNIVGDSRSLERAYAKATASSKKFNATVTGQAKQASAAFVGFTPGQVGAVGIGLALKKSVDAASDLNEQMNRSRVVFGSSADSVEKWSGTLATGFGVSQRAALKAAGDFGTMFETIGLADKPAADMSKRLVELGADMASFNNADPSDMLDRLRSGLAGEAEPLRRFGVLLSEARVKQEAYTSGIARQGSTLTEQQKVQGRYNLILKDTAVQQGDALKTGDALAGQQRRLKAQVDNLSASIGQGLVPGLTDLLGAFNDAIEGGRKFNDEVLGKIGANKSGLQYIHDLTGALDKLNTAFGGSTFGPPLTPGQGALALMPNAAFGFDPRLPINPIAPGAFGATTGKQQDQFQFGGLPPGASTKLRNQWFDAMIGRELVDVQDIATAQGKIAQLKVISGQITARIAVTKDITRKLTLEAEVKARAREIRGLQESIAATALAAAEAGKAAAQEAKRLAVDEAFGWLDFAIERAGATKTLKDDIAAQRDKEAALKELIRREGRKLDLVRELWRTQEKIADLNKSNADIDPMAGLMQVGSARLAQILAAGTGLGMAGQRRLGQNIAGAEIRPLTIQNTTYLDGQVVARSTNQHNARGAQRTDRQTSGRR